MIAFRPLAGPSRQRRIQRPISMLASPSALLSLVAVFALLLGFFAPGSLHAQVVLDTALEELPEPQLDDAGESLPLSLEQAIEIALRRNLDLVLQRYDRASAELGLGRDLGIYDPNLTASYTLTDETFSAGSDLDGAAVRTDEDATWRADLSQLTPYGGTATFSLFQRRISTNNVNVPLNPQYTQAWDLRFVQPLLRNFGRLATERQLLLTRRDIALSQEAFEQQVITVIQSVENAYWNLVRSRKQLEVSQQSLDLAQELLERNKIRVEVGTLAPFELVQSEAGVARREGDIIRNSAAVGDAEDELRRLLNLDEGQVWNLELVPTTQAEVSDLDVSVDSAIAIALEERSELQTQDLTVERLEVESKYFDNQQLPGLDLDVTYGPTAVAGSTGDAFDIIRDRDFDGWTIRLSATYDIGNRSAKARSAIADVALDRGRTARTQLEQRIATEVRSAVRQLEAAAKEVDAARASREAQEKSLEAERKRFENGMSTSFQVLQIQEDLATAQSEEVRAITSYRNQLTEYQRSIGRLLTENGVELTDSVAEASAEDDEGGFWDFLTSSD
ncbi:MAG: TolC family protein [Acidobacteriota bacterium]